MNNTTNKRNNQILIVSNSAGAVPDTAVDSSTPLRITRAERRPQDKEAKKIAEREQKSRGQKPGKKRELSKEEQDCLKAIEEELRREMKGLTWRSLEVGRRFDQDSKINMITDDTLVLGVDVASEKHDIRAFDFRKRELSSKAYEFANSREGFEKAQEWILDLMAKNEKKRAIMGIEPTGHYWFNLYIWMKDHGITVVMVNPFAVNRIKEVDDNQQLKNDLKDPKTIAGLVIDGRYSVPYLPEGDYAELRGFAQLRDRAIESLVRAKNRLHRWTKIYFTAYDEIFNNIDAENGLLFLERGLFPEDLRELGVDGINNVFRESKMRGSGRKRAEKIYEAACRSLGITDGKKAARVEVIDLVQEIRRAQKLLTTAETEMERYCKAVSNTEGILEIRGITMNTLAPVLADLGDISRFDSDDEIIKLSGLAPVVCESGKYKGMGKISKRGRKRLRAYGYKMAISVVIHAPEFKEFHEYYTTREHNPLKPMQSLMVIACKLLRIIRHLLLTGEKYDPEKMRSQIKRMKEVTVSKAA